jgi:hypothetical protein
MTWTMLAVEVIYWMERAAYNGHSCILTFLWKLLDINNNTTSMTCAS